MTEAITLESLLQSPLHQQERWKYASLAHVKAASFSSPSVIADEFIKEKIQALRHELSADACFMVVVNGEWQPKLSDALPLGCEIETVALNDASVRPFNARIYPFAALNQSNLRSSFRLKVKENAQIQTNVILVTIADAMQPTFVQSRMEVWLSAKASLQVTEVPMMVGESATLLNQLITIRAEANASLTWVKFQALPNLATQLSHYEILQMKESHTHFINLTEGARFSRDEVVVHLLEPGAVAKASGFYQLTRDHQFADNHIEICHEAPHTESEMHYKGTMDGTSKAVFNGRLLVNPGAQKITATQANHNLLLSNAAEIYTKPELEIYADDVKCKHGATIGQLDEDAIFYLQSRGIEKQEARAILMAGFMDEVMALVPFQAVRAYAKARMTHA